MARTAANKETETAPAAKTETAPAAKTETAPAFEPKVKRRVTLPLFKWVIGKPKYLKVEGDIFEGKAVQDKKGETAAMAPAHLMNVTDLETGELGQVIVGTVLEGIMTEEYPEGAYVGMGFEIVQNKVEGKRYKTYSVAELDLA